MTNFQISKGIEEMFAGKHGNTTLKNEPLSNGLVLVLDYLMKRGECKLMIQYFTSNHNEAYQVDDAVMVDRNSNKLSIEREIIKSHTNNEVKRFVVLPQEYAQSLLEPKNITFMEINRRVFESIERYAESICLNVAEKTADMKMEQMSNGSYITKAKIYHHLEFSFVPDLQFSKQV